LLETLFPLKPQKNKSQLVGKSASVKIVQKKNQPPYDKGGKYPYQRDAELFLPAAPIPGVPASLA
jgi:hypothetical protein